MRKKQKTVESVTNYCPNKRIKSVRAQRNVKQEIETHKQIENNADKIFKTVEWFFRSSLR